MANYYELLGISKTASATEIKNAYRKLALKYHPDRNPGNLRAMAHFKEINTAYEVLGDPSSKAAYDRQRNESSTPPESHTVEKVYPEIVHFIADRTKIFDGDTILFAWRCEHADTALFSPTGLVKTRGSKKIKFNAFQAPSVEVTLTAYNTEHKTKTTRIFTIYNIEHLPEEERLQMNWFERHRWFKKITFPLFRGFIFTLIMIFGISGMIEYNKNEQKRLKKIQDNLKEEQDGTHLKSVDTFYMENQSDTALQHIIDSLMESTR